MNGTDKRENENRQNKESKSLKMISDCLSYIISSEDFPMPNEFLSRFPTHFDLKLFQEQNEITFTSSSRQWRR